MIVEAVKWIGGIDGCLELIDQRRLPAEFVKLQCRNVETLFEAIKTLVVRGAPAIGVSAAYGLVLALQKLDTNESIEKSLSALKNAREYLASSRPTAVNLFWALDRVWKAASEVENLQQLREVTMSEANAHRH
jgi:methylthioribose-1-phosphate isomerase